MDLSKCKEYVGKNIENMLQDKYKAEVYRVNWEQLHINYGDNVEFERLARQVWLCPATRDVIYAPPAPVRYRRGDRPLLDRIVDEVCAGASGDREKALSLLVFCRDLYKKHDNEQLFYGGTEEELIQKGERLCECLGRLYVALAEVAGIPGRIVMHIAAGHITSELYIDGKWSYFDPRWGLFYLLPDGRFASVEDCVNDPSLLCRQPEEPRKYVSALVSYEYRAAHNFAECLHREEIQCFCDYSLTDAADYHFGWVSCAKAEKDGLFVLSKRYAELTGIIFSGWKEE